MNQKFLAGLGNIYVNEAIFMCKINPKMKSSKIPNGANYCISFKY